MELTELFLADAAALIARRKLSPVELTRAYLQRIGEVDPLLNSYITVAEERAMARATTAERHLGQNKSPGPLHGIPLAHKDLFDTRGIRTTAGSAFLADHLPRQDAAVVARLQHAGAITLGKLNMDEWATDVRGKNPHYGTCRNPWNRDRIPGGSSGGAAAALAARLCLGAMGSDAAGSIRLPAALCGVVGLKPTFGRVSRRGAWPLSWNLDHAGPMARSVRDVAYLLQSVAGYDPADPYAVDRPVGEYLADLEAGVAGWRIRVAYDHFSPAGKEAEPEVLAIVEAAVRQFARLGARVKGITLEGAYEAMRAALTIIISDAAAFHRERLAEQAETFGEQARESLRRGERNGAVDYALARREQVRFSHRLARLFQDCDLLLTPTAGSAAPSLAEQAGERRARPALVSYTAPFNLARLPALSLPCGFTRAGLPVGLQLIGPPWAEARLLRAARAYERATGWHHESPPPASG